MLNVWQLHGKSSQDDKQCALLSLLLLASPGSHYLSDAGEGLEPWPVWLLWLPVCITLDSQNIIGI